MYDVSGVCDASSGTPKPMEPYINVGANTTVNYGLGM